MKEKFTFIAFFIFCNLLYSQNTILWKITNSKNDKTSYLLGTLHQFGENFANKFPKIESCISKSDLSVFESLEIDSLATQKIINNRNEDNVVEKYLNAKEIAKIKNFVEKSDLNIYQITPIELKFKLQQKYTQLICQTVAKNELNNHFDAFLIKLSDKHKINKLGFETLEEQLELLNRQYHKFTWKNQKKDIFYYLDNINSANPNIADKENLCEFAAKYQRFDLEYQFQKNSSLEVLLNERNNKWIDKIIPLLEQKNLFIAVGIMHLMYKEGLINRLRQSGFVVEPENMNE